MERATPDLLVPYSVPGGAAMPEDSYKAAYALVAVRPETNRVFYEGEILSAIRNRADVVYLANLNGRLFLDRGILRDHYASQYRMASDPRAAIKAYPELASAFERHFGLPWEKAPVAGSFEAVERLGMAPEELFSTIVPDVDFLACCGQTFKRVQGSYIVNYDLPAIESRYTREANVFVVLARAEGVPENFYVGLNHAIYEEVLSRPETPIVFGDKLGGLAWSEKIRRTYHISTNRLQAMLDMADFVFTSHEDRLDVADTPLGRALVDAGALGAEDLRRVKAAHLCRVAGPSEGFGLGALAFLPQAGIGLDFTALSALMRRIAVHLG
jgi:hypothetical protein